MVQIHKIKVDSLFPIKFANTIHSQLPRICFAVLVYNNLSHSLSILHNIVRQLTHIIDKMKARRDEMFEFDKSFEKTFKKEFPGLGFNQLEALMKCFKKRPKGVAVAIEQHLALSSGKDFRKSHDSLAAYGAAGAQRHGGKDLKAKSIAAALERVSTN